MQRLLARHLSDMGIEVSLYLIRRTLKKHGIYQVYQKGLTIIK